MAHYRVTVHAMSLKYGCNLHPWKIRGGGRSRFWRKLGEERLIKHIALYDLIIFVACSIAFCLPIRSLGMQREFTNSSYIFVFPVLLSLIVGFHSTLITCTKFHIKCPKIVCDSGSALLGSYDTHPASGIDLNLFWGGKIFSPHREGDWTKLPRKIWKFVQLTSQDIKK